MKLERNFKNDIDFDGFAVPKRRLEFPGFDLLRGPSPERVGWRPVENRHARYPARPVDPGGCLNPTIGWRSGW